MMANNHGAGAQVAPFGGVARRLATDPMAFGMPTDDPDAPIVLDMATSVVAEGKVRVARNAERAVPGGWLLDGAGRPSAEPADLYGDPRGALLPLGGEAGHKGFGLALVVEALAGALSPAGTTRPDFERSGIGTSIGTHKSLRELLERAKALPEGQSQLDEGHVRLGFADRTIDAEVSLLFSYHLMSMQAANLMPNYEASMAKMFGSEMNQRIARLHMQVYGLYGLLYDPSERPGETTQPSYRYLRSAANTIEGGSSEIQRNIIATRGLGLPRG